MKTELLYLSDSQIFETHGAILEIHQDSKGFYFILDKTIFYPQGGGQASDTGSISFTSGESAEVYHVACVEDKVHHYVKEDPRHLKVGTLGLMSVDKERRLLNTRSHSAGHLLGHIFEQLHPQSKAVKGHHFPGECYVEFLFPKETPGQDLTIINKAIEEVIGKDLSSKTFLVEKEAIIALNLPYEIQTNKPLRVHEINDYKPIPCGGTHVKSLQQIGKIIVTKVKVKGDRIKVSYEIG